MKLKKLLLAASAVAMAASNANALDLVVTNPTTPVTPALELAFPQPAGNAVALQFTINTDIVTGNTVTPGGDFPAGNNLLVTITLPAGTSFATLVTGDVVSSVDGTASAVVQGTTGQVGQDSVSFLVSIPQGATIDELQFGVSDAINVTLDECAATPTLLTATVTTEGGTPIQSGVASDDSFVSACRSAVELAAFDDNATITNFATPGTPGGVLDTDTFITLPDFDDLSDPVVGFLNGFIDPTVSRDINGTPVDTTDIDEVAFNVVLEDPTGIDGIQILGEFVATVAGQTVYPFVFDSQADITSLFDNAPDPIVLFETGGVAIPTQQLSVTGVETRFVQGVGSNANFVESETYGDFDIDFLQREGQQFGAFDWNGGSLGGGTNSVYRITGLDQVNDTPFTLTLSNSTPETANGTYRGVIPAAEAAASGGEGVLGSLGNFASYGLVIPEFARADVTMNFESNAGIDVDRLMSRGGTISDFGDGANSTDFGIGTDPNSDADDNTGTE